MKTSGNYFVAGDINSPQSVFANTQYSYGVDIMRNSTTHTEPYLKTAFVPRSKHSIPIIKSSKLSCCRGKELFFVSDHTQHINPLCGQNVEFLTLDCCTQSKRHASRV